jgi:NADH:ubiquinone oxidoreductase subunit H
MILLKIVCLLVAIAYYTIAERKIMAAIQRRRGPNVVGFWGLLQPLADGLKLIAKEMVIPSHSNSRIFVIAPLCVLTLSLLSWSILPFGCFDYTEYATISNVTETLYAAAGPCPDGKKKGAAIVGPLLVEGSCFVDPDYYVNEMESRVFKQTLMLVVWAGFGTLLGIPNEFIAGGLTFLGFLSFQDVLVCKYSGITPPDYTTMWKLKDGDFEYKINGASGKVTEITRYVDVVEVEKFFVKESSLFDMLVEGNDISDVRYGLLVILALSSLSVYGLIIAGWSSSSKYAFLGALRSAAQMISYEVSISLIIIPVIFMAGSLNFTEIVMAQAEVIFFILPLFPLSIIFFISMIAETNRTPFDLPEAEAELVAGYNVEYSSIIFAMFFLAEYGNMILMSIIKSELFFGGWIGITLLPAATVVALKALIFCFAFVLVRATFPRYRYDQLMDIGWKIFLPVSTGLLILVIGVVMAYSALPVVMELNCADYSEPHLS